VVKPGNHIPRFTNKTIRIVNVQPFNCDFPQYVRNLLWLTENMPLTVHIAVENKSTALRNACIAVRNVIMQARSTLHHQMFSGIQATAFLYTILVSLVRIAFAKKGIQFTYPNH
jgi:hypothetical protein